MEDRHERERQLWAEMKLQYEAQAQGHTAKINALKKSLDELRAKTNMGPERIRTLLHTHRGNSDRAIKILSLRRTQLHILLRSLRWLCTPEVSTSKKLLHCRI